MLNAPSLHRARCPTSGDTHSQSGIPIRCDHDVLSRRKIVQPKASFAVDERIHTVGKLAAAGRLGACRNANTVAPLTG